MPSASRSLRLILTVGVAVMAIGVVAAQGPGGAGPGPRGQAKGKKKAFTSEQVANVQERIAIAVALVNQNQEEAQAQGLSLQGWRQATLDSLLSLPVGKLRKLQGAHGVQSLAAAVAEATAAVQAETDAGLIGDSTEDLTYKPITPCRYIDTRNVAAGKINGYRGFDLAIAGNVYGGVAACAPTTVFGVAQNLYGGLAMNVTVVDTSTGAPGFVAVKPTQAAPLTSLLNWYEAGASVQVANMGIVTMDQSGALEEFWIQTSGAVHVIVDLFGAFVAPEATALECLTTAATTVTIAAGQVFSVFPPACPAGYTQVAVGCRSNAYDSANWAITGYYVPGTGWGSCWGTNISGSSNDFDAYGRCCRVPGR